MRRLLGAVLGLMTVLPSAAAALPRVEGTVTVTGHGSTLVELTRHVDVEAGPPDIGPQLSASFQGGGALRMLVLRGDWEGYPTDGVAFVGVGDQVATASFGILPAGRYRLYLVSDAPGLTATLRVAGESGRSEIAVGEPARWSTFPMTLGADSAGSTLVYAWHAFVEPGVLVANVRTRGTVGHEEWCQESEYADQASSYAPGCGDAGVFGGTVLTTGTETGLGWMPEAGHLLGVGGNLRYAGDADLQAVAGILRFDPPTPPAAVAPSPQSPARLGLDLLSPRGRVRGGRALVRVRCRAATRCEVSAALGAGPPAARSVAPGATAVLRVPLTRAVRRRLAARGRMMLTLRLRAGDDEVQLPFEVRR